MIIPCTVEELLKRWHKRLRELQFSQYEAARRLSTCHYLIGISSILITGFVGSSVFSSLKSELSDDFKLVLGLIALLGTLLTSLQTFLKLNERAEKHKLSGAKAASVRRRIEQLISFGDFGCISQIQLDEIREVYDVITSEAPEVPSNIFKKTVEKFRSDQ